MASEIDLEFLPLLYEIINSVKKDSSETTVKIHEFKTKFEKVKEEIEKLPGIDHSPEAQLHQLDILQKQLRSKTDLLVRYKNLCNFDTNS